MKQTLGYKSRQQRKRTADEQRAAETFRRDVFHRAEGRSQLTGAQDYPMDPHHCIKAQQLRRIAPELVWDPDVGMLLTREEHTRHHNRGTVISFEQLPDYVRRFAEIHDLTWHLEWEHPRRPCARCHGDGEIMVNTSRNRDPQEDRSEGCPDCHGTGAS